MYPAWALGDGFYTFEDLPDKLIYKPGLVNLYKLNPPESDGDVTIYYSAGLPFDEDVKIVTVGPLDEVEIWFIKLGDDINTSSTCLITDFLTSDLKDDFEDTYTAQMVLTQAGADSNIWDILDISGSQYAGTYNVSLTRESLCEWRGTLAAAFNFPPESGLGTGDLVVILYYLGRYTFEPTDENGNPLPPANWLTLKDFKWVFQFDIVASNGSSISGSSGLYPVFLKEFQSSPEGLYNDDRATESFTSDDWIITVT